MTTIQRIGSMLVTSMLLAACGSSAEDARHEPPAMKDTAFGDLAGTLDEARAVEGTTLRHKQAIDEALERDEGTQ
jgi:hypothetical protein